MTAAEIITEWRRGCSHTSELDNCGSMRQDLHPERCFDCTTAMLKALTRKTGYQHRWVIYCLSDDLPLTPGKSAGYLSWLHRQWSDWLKENGGRTSLSWLDHKRFDCWLAGRFLKTEQAKKETK